MEDEVEVLMSSLADRMKLYGEEDTGNFVEKYFELDDCFDLNKFLKQIKLPITYCELIFELLFNLCTKCY